MGSAARSGASRPMTIPSTAIAFDKVALSLGGERIYDDISFTLAEGEFVCILGASGCGKSTSLRIIGDLLDPDSGHVSVRGKPPAESWRDIAFVFQSPRLAPWRNVLSNVLLGVELRFGRAEAKRRTGRAKKLLEMVGLADAGAKFPLMLSGGERQRVAIGRALAVDPSIMLMDEPFSALDPNTRRRLRGEIERIWLATKITVVFVTHDIDEAITLADRVILLSSKPTKVLESIRIDAPRPRDVAGEPALRAIRNRLQDLFNSIEASADRAITQPTEA
jgi:NitT/TauT family transport system ATP-binding protein